MFGLLTNAIENAFDVADDFFGEGKLDKRKVARLIDDGMTVAAIASAAGVGVAVVQEILDDE